MISSEFIQNVELRDLDTVRSALIDYLIIDPSFRSFDEALAYAQNNMNIIEPFNNEPPFSEEPWDSNYLNQQKVALMMNFSTERINHIKKVILKVPPAKRPQNRTASTPHNTNHSTGGSGKTGSRVIKETVIQSRKNDDSGKHDTDFLSTALIVGGAAVAVVGIVTVEPLVIGTGVVVAGTGVGLKVKNGR